MLDLPSSSSPTLSSPRKRVKVRTLTENKQRATRCVGARAPATCARLLDRSDCSIDCDCLWPNETGARACASAAATLTHARAPQRSARGGGGGGDNNDRPSDRPSLPPPPPPPPPPPSSPPSSPPPPPLPLLRDRHRRREMREANEAARARAQVSEARRRAHSPPPPRHRTHTTYIIGLVVSRA